VITPTAREGGYLPIAAYGLVGDCRSAALVGSDGSVDWLCLPRFDSPSVFGRLLDARRGGHWQLAPRGPYRVLQRYGERGNVLQTLFETRTGRVLLSDLMPVGGDASDPRMVRIVECLGGEMTLRHDCLPAPGYACDGPAEPAFEAGTLRVEAGGQWVVVAGSEPLTGTREELHLLAGESVALGLHVTGVDPPAPAWSTERALLLRRQTEDHWWAWAARCGDAGPYQGAVVRSALALRMLTQAPDGALVASPTTSLPGAGGRARTRDLRLTSLRDAAAAPAVFRRLGLVEDADAVSGWLERHGAGGGGGGLVALDGGPGEAERTLRHLEGYRGRAPVRVGGEGAATGGAQEAALAGAFQRAGALARRGEVEPARRLFELLLTNRSPLGLLSGETDPRTGELLGNFPRAATHLALITAALEIERARIGAGSGPGMWR
jgi:GH15 family glucan-1,4-alpha-glucosidase